MPASLPGSTASANGSGIPSAGRVVSFDALSGPKSSPLDKDTAGNASTGGLSTGIGLSPQGSVIRLNPRTKPQTAAQAIIDAGFTDDSVAGAPGSDSTKIYIGGGKSTANVNGKAPTVPYTAGYAICHAGNGQVREASALGTPSKVVTAVGAVADGAAVETGWLNRSGVALVSGDSVWGVGPANVAPA
jgi:hypothetical protein